MQAANETPVRPRQARVKTVETPIAVPLVLQNLDLTGLKLSSDGVKALVDLRQSFIGQIGGPGQDPKDPAYRERWKKAQADVNDSLEAMIGRSAYQSYQFEIQSAAVREAGPRDEK